MFSFICISRFALFAARRSSRIALRLAEAADGLLPAAFSPVLSSRSVRSTPALTSERVVFDAVPTFGGSLKFFGGMAASGRATSDLTSARVVPEVLPVVLGGSLRLGGGVPAPGRTTSDLTSARVAGVVGFCAAAKPDAASRAVINNDVVVYFILIP